MYEYCTFTCYDGMVIWLNEHTVKPEHIIDISKNHNGDWMCLIWVDSPKT